MEKGRTFDFWYAVNNTEVVLMPRQHLETFGATVLNYHLVTELMDAANQVRVREGRILANQPRIITPEAYSNVLLEGFGAEAEKYIQWLKEHETQVRVLQYGYRLKQESFSEHVITDRKDVVVKRVKDQVQQSGDALSAVVAGVDEPWDVCLVKLFWQVIQQSAQANIRELGKKRMLDYVDGAPRAVHAELEADFLAASRDASLIGALGGKLRQYGLFDEYQDRFFSLVKANRGG